MANQYWIGGFFIDLSRNQITLNKRSQILAPKALAVLTYLAENQGVVVSHDALLSHVWKGTVVSPNTLQRSIAQLRKALGDDGKEQIYIKTHAKRGYSLESDVRWHNQPELYATQVRPASDSTLNDNEVGQEESLTKRRISFPKWLLICVVSIILMGILGYANFVNEEKVPLQLGNVRPLTATDDKEFDASYSPDGKYIVFHRYLDKQCGNKLWAKNSITQEETQLTKEWAAYGRHSFSTDGKKLVFLATSACSEPTNQRQCYDLMSLDFDQALQQPQQPRVILQCRNSKVKKPIWLNDNRIALLQQESDRWKLITYSISENKSQDVYEVIGGNIVDFAYSPKDDLIAVISIHEDGKDYIEILEPGGRIISSSAIQRDRDLPQFHYVRPTFDPHNKQLIFSTGRRLFTLSYDGKTNRIGQPFADRITQPEFHPEGSRMVLIKGPYDSDIVRLQRNDLSEPIDPPQQLDKRSFSYESFERSNRGENHALFQPGGNFIAYWSERSGDEQIWIHDGENSRQLTQFSIDSFIRGIEWAKDGNSLLVNVNRKLKQIDLDGRENSLILEHPVVTIFDWDSDKNTALSSVRIKGVVRFAEIDLDTSTIRKINDKKVVWARKTETGEIIYKDHLGQFWRPGPAEDQLISELNGHGGRSKIFEIDKNVIYSINESDQLWSYDLSTQAFKIIARVSEDVNYLSDISQSEILMTVRIAAKKEVVELSIDK